MDNSIIANTHQLKSLLVKADETGIIAWQIGSIASTVKNSKSYKNISGKEYNYFRDYTIKELDKSEHTINAYISIFKSFDNPNEISSMLVTHLTELSKIKTEKIRKIATKIFKNLQDKYILADDKKKERVYTVAEIKQVVNIIGNDESLTEKEIKLIVDDVFRMKNEKYKTKNSHKVGKKLETVIIPELQYLLEYEPIDEQGTVALFCLAFERLRDYSFEIFINGYLEKLNFDTLRFVRAKFPDASILCKKSRDKSERLELLIEFEFVSSRYWKHIYSNEVCHMIICWQDDINGQNIPQQRLAQLPPILSMKEFLKTGKIELINK